MLERLGEEDKRTDKMKSVKVSKKSKEQINLLDLIPIKNCKWTHQKEKQELVRIMKPRFDSGFGKKLGKKLKVKETYNVNLDEYGTAVWRLCDGILSVREIGEQLKTQFDEDVEPLYPRLASFFRILESNNFIIFKPKQARKMKKQSVK